jgi:uncharacterized tellurite resistance protein B-like protein
MPTQDANHPDANHADAWTRTHDLALVYLALAHGTDQELADAEMSAITKALGGWREDLSEAQVLEVVMEALAVYLSGGAEQEVRRSITALGDLLSEESRKRVMDEIVGIARADGVVVGNERGFIEAVATQWDLRVDMLKIERGGEGSHADVEEGVAWSLLHDVALLAIVVAHAPDGELTDQEIAATLSRLGAWEPGLGEKDLRGVLRVALRYYSEFEDADALQESVTAVADYLSPGQRLAVLDDLVAIARVDGGVDEKAESLLTAFGTAWSVPIRLEEQSAAQA